MMEKREYCYCFTDTTSHDIKHFFLANGLKIIDSYYNRNSITDYYLNKTTRLRKINDKFITFEHKKDYKKTVRVEESHAISPPLAELLQNEAKLVVEKERETWIDSDTKSWVFSISTVIKPFKIIIAEVECKDKATFHLVGNMDFNRKLKRNTKSAWDYFKRKIGFCGAPACGKTVMVRSLVNKLAIEYGANAEAVTEFARSYVSHYGPPKWYVQPLITWQQQLREIEATYANIILCDSPTFLSTLYAQFYHKKPLNDTSIFILSEMYKNALQASRTYSDIILLDKKDLKKDGLRYQDETENEKIHSLIYNFLTTYNIPFIQTNYHQNLDELISEIFTLNHINK
jgi:nicotinamide riboside kinase